MSEGTNLHLTPYILGYYKLVQIHYVKYFKLTHKIIHLVIHINHDQMNILTGKGARTLNKRKVTKNKDNTLMYNQTQVRS